MPASPQRWILRLVIPLAAAGALFTVAALERDPTAAADSRYLATLSTAVLFALAYVAPRVGPAFAGWALLVVLAMWAAAPLPGRGAAVSALLVTGLFVCTALAIRGEALRGEPLRGEPLRNAAYAGSLLAAHFLASSDRFLDLDATRIVEIVFWPGLAAVAIWRLTARSGVRAAALAAGIALLVEGSISPLLALGLVAIAVTGEGLRRHHPIWMRVVPGAVVVALLAVDWRAGTAVAVVALVAGAPAGMTRSLLAVGALVAGAVVAVVGIGSTAPTGPAAALDEISTLFVLLPLLVLDPRNVGSRLAILAAALGAALSGSGTAALAVAGAALALTTRESKHDSRAVQETWTAACLFGFLVHRSPPWLRENALADTLDRLAPLDGWGLAIVVVVGGLVIRTAVGGVPAVLSRHRQRGHQSHARGSSDGGSRTRNAMALTAGVVVLAVVIALPRDSRRLIRGHTIVVDSGTPRWETELEPAQPARWLVIDSSLSNSTAAAAGTALARLSIETEDGTRHFDLRLGYETGEWAARRPDVAAIPGFEAPQAFVSWTDGSGEFFGQRYRARFELPPGARASRFRVELTPEAPENLALTVFHVELRS